MKAIFLRAMLLGWGLLAHLAGAQSGPATFPLTGDWQGVWEFQGNVHHLVLHMNTTPEGKMTVLLDDIDLKVSGVPPIGGSFDGSRLTLRFTYWKPNSSGDLESRVATYEATVNASNSEMTGVWTQEGSWPLELQADNLAGEDPQAGPAHRFRRRLGGRGIRGKRYQNPLYLSHPQYRGRADGSSRLSG